MKILRCYILELCFILSFALPFIRGANADNGRRFVETYYGFTFLMDHLLVTAVFICSLLIAWLVKSSGRNGLLLVVIYFDFVDCYRRISIPYVTRRFDTTLDKFGNLDTNLSVGFYLNIILGILLIIKYFKVKNSNKMYLITDDLFFS